MSELDDHINDLNKCRKTKCKGLVAVNTENKIIGGNFIHNHEPMSKLEFEIINTRKEIKNKIISDPNKV
jgi:hypothetical protein